MSVLVVGLGNPHAGDDAVGVLVADAVARRALPGVRVVTHEDPTDLPLLWAGAEAVVVVDAVLSGRPVGTVVVLDEEGSLPVAAASGTHDFGLADAFALSRALGTLPARWVVVGVEGRSLTPGTPISDAVAAAVGDAADAVAASLRAGESGSGPWAKGLA